MLLTSLQKYPWLTMCYQILRKEKLTIEVEKTLLSSKNRGSSEIHCGIAFIRNIVWMSFLQSKYPCQ